MRRRHLLPAILVAWFVWSGHTTALASPLGLRFSGTLDLAEFGASPASTVAGSVTWDPDQSCGPGAGEGDFPLSPLEGDPPCVTATLEIDAVENHAFDLQLSRLMLFADGMVLQLWFDPPADLDGADGADLRLMELALWQPVSADSPVFADVGALPSDLHFLRQLTDRSLVMSAPACFEPEAHCINARASTLSVVSEAPSVALLLLGLAAAGLWARRRPGHRARVN